jgi:nitrite reductase/ring-hydroxylating ferredoxin subunit
MALGLVKTVTPGRTSLLLINVADKFTAMDKPCPHQVGPLGDDGQ